VPTAEGWLYLAAVIDLCSRKVVGWATADHLRADLAVEALRMALTHRRPAGGLLHHSDRGVQYASDAYQSLLATHGIEPSMSRTGDCWDNAVVESFFGTLKRELVHHESYASRAEARRSLFEYIEVFYNRRHRHSTLGYRSPAEFEACLTSSPTRAHCSWGRSSEQVGAFAEGTDSSTESVACRDHCSVHWSSVAAGRCFPLPVIGRAVARKRCGISVSRPGWRPLRNREGTGTPFGVMFGVKRGKRRPRRRPLLAPLLALNQPGVLHGFRR
jgi:integrase-like protein